MSSRKHEDGEEEPPSRRRRMNEHDEELNIETEHTRNSQQDNPISQTTGLVNEEANTNSTTSAGISNQVTGTRTMNESTSQQENNNNISEQNVEPVEGGSENPASVNNIVENERTSSNEIIQRRPNLGQDRGRGIVVIDRHMLLRELRELQLLLVNSDPSVNNFVHIRENLLRILPRQVELQRRALFPLGLSDEKFNEFERITYGADKEEDDKLDVCPICIEPRKSGETIVILPCTHKYHENCAKGLFKNMTKCGVCRKDYNVNV